MLRLLPAGIALAALVAGAPQDPAAFSLACEGPVREAGRLRLRFRGEGRLPDRSVLTASVTRRFEHWEAGRLKIRVADAGGFSAQVGRGRFAGTCSVPSPGVYGCRVELLDNNQGDAVRPLVLTLDPKAWTRLFHAFDDAVVRDLEPALGAVESLAARALAVLKDFEKATATEETWKAGRKGVEDALNKLHQDLQLALSGAVYPAALTELHSTIEVAVMNLPYLAFKDGAFDGANDYHGGKAKTHRGELYGHEAFRRCVEEAPAIAGRELCLWILKDVRRSAGLRPEAAEMLGRLAQKPGVAEFAERLAAVTPEQVDALEQDVREAKLK